MFLRKLEKALALNKRRIHVEAKSWLNSSVATNVEPALIRFYKLHGIKHVSLCCALDARQVTVTTC